MSKNQFDFNWENIFLLKTLEIIKVRIQTDIPPERENFAKIQISYIEKK